MWTVQTLDDLHELYGEAKSGSLQKVADHLTPNYRKWIELSRFCILSTVGPEATDASPRGDDGPVVRVADAKTLLMPDWQGNNRLDSLRNIVRDPRVSLMFMIPGEKNVVRINGRAVVSKDPELLQSFEQRRKHPATVIVTTVDEVYFQCAKAIMRSGLWQQGATEGVPTAGDLLSEMTKGVVGGASYDATYEENAKARMW